MKFKNSDIYMAMTGKESPFAKLIDQKFPVKTSYAIAKMVGKIDDQFKVIESVRTGLIKKYGTKDEKGNLQVNQDTEAWQKFLIEFNELMEQDVEIVTEKVKIPSDKLEIEPTIMMALMPFVEVE
jgi:hypothetical protein